MQNSTLSYFNSHMNYNFIMADTETTNSAQRAKLFVEYFRDNSNASDGIRNKLVRHALASMYDLQATDNSSLMTVLSDAWRLPGQIRIDLKKSGLDPDDFADATSALENFLSQLNIDSQAQSVKNSIPPNLLSSLRMIGGILNKDLPEAVLSDADKILESIDLLEKDIRKAKFETDFSDYLLHRLASIRYAVSHYDTLGQDELMSRVDQMFGGVFRRYDKLVETKKKKDLTHRLLRIGAMIVYAISAFNGAVELPTNMNKFLGEGVIREAELIIDTPPELDNSSRDIG